MQLTTNFILQEYVNPVIFERIGERSFNFLHPSMIDSMQMLREDIDDGITICNWHSGGNYRDSGLRHPTQSPGATLSGHKFGNCCDCKFASKTTDEVFDYIMAHQRYYGNITRIENIEHTRTKYGKNGRDWLHLEFGVRRGAIRVFNP